MTSPQVAIVGAGIAGLSCARALAERGITSQLFDKSRGPGGRISSKRAAPSAVDLGAQYFTAREPAFQAQVETAAQAGALARWQPRIATASSEGFQLSPDDQNRWVGTPRMGAFAHFLAEGLDIAPATRIETLDALRQRFDRIVLAIPADQARDLVSGVAPPAQAPCWAAWVDIDVDQPFDAAFVSHDAVRWIANDSSKPGRTHSRRWVVHATPQWSQDHLELTPAQALSQLIDAARTIMPAAFSVVDSGIHRWRFARPWDGQPPVDGGCILVDEQVILAGDYCMGGRVEGAWLSGRHAAELI